MTYDKFALIACAALTLACAGDDGPSIYSTGGQDPETGSSSSSSTGDGDGDGETSSYYDFAVTDSDGDALGCKNVDFLFLVDASPSMVDEQQLLISASSQWIDTIQAELPDAASNYRVMVVDLDDEWGESACEGCVNGCTYQDGSFEFDVPDYPCGHEPSLCDMTLGAAVTFPAGADASNMDCGFPEGRRWLQADDPGVDGSFACAARVGASGSGDEQVGRALRRAVGDALQGPGGCNEGFLRNDAILVVVVVTDEDEGDFVEDQLFVEEFGPMLREELYALKGGDDNGIVVVGMINDYGFEGVCDSPPDLAIDGAKNLRAFIEGFSRYELASVCSPDFVGPLSNAVATISAACDEYVPVP